MRTFLSHIFKRPVSGLFAAFVPLVDTSQSPMLSNVYNSGDLGAYVNALFTTALSVGAILAVLRIAYAGYEYMTTDAWGSKQHAKEILGDVTLGLLLLLSIFLILKQINPDLLNLNVLTKVNQVQSTGQPNQPAGQTTQTSAPQGSMFDQPTIDQMNVQAQTVN